MEKTYPRTTLRQQRFRNLRGHGQSIWGTVRLRTEELVKIDRYTSDVLDEEKFRQEHHNYVVQEFAQRLGVSTEEAIRLYEELNSKFTD